MTPKIEDHDFQVKLRPPASFLKMEIRLGSGGFRGREIVHADLGRKLLNRLAAELQDVAVERDSGLKAEAWS